MLTALQVDFRSTDDLRKLLEKLTIKDLQNHLKGLNLRSSGKKKSDLQLRLFGCIIDRELSLTPQNEESTITNKAAFEVGDDAQNAETMMTNQVTFEVADNEEMVTNPVVADASDRNSANEDAMHDTQTSTKSLVWEKGGWLSLVINVPKQIERMGPLRWIWLVSHHARCFFQF